MRRKNRNVVTLKYFLAVYIIGGILIIVISKISVCRGSYVA